MNINNWVGTGNLTRDMEVKYISTGTAVGKFSLAINKRVKKGDRWTDKAIFLDVTLWGKQAESLAQYLTKGTPVAIHGELDVDTWEKDGQRHSKTFLVANTIQLLGGKKDQGSRPILPPAEAAGSPMSFDNDIHF